MTGSGGDQSDLTIPPFGFGTAARVLFGAGRAAELPALVANWGGRALVVTGAKPERHNHLIRELPMPAEIFPVTGEPTVQTAREAADRARARRRRPGHRDRWRQRAGPRQGRGDAAG